VIVFARTCALALALLLASASAGASRTRPPVALAATPAHVDLEGTARAAVSVRNSGSRSVVVDVSRAGFALDLRGRPKLVARNAVPRSAADWLSFRPRSLVLRPGTAGAVTIASKVPRGAEPGDHDALVLVTSRRQARDGLAVRMRMGIVVVVRAPGEIVHRLALRGLGVGHGSRSSRFLELGVSNRGNVTETLERAGSVLSLFRADRRVARLTAVPRDLRPGTSGVLQFRYRGRLVGPYVARVDLTTEAGVYRRTFRLKL
jgi:hypothetical protein